MPIKMSVRDTGILRKKTNQPTNFDSLLIVGYQSRVFRDDEKAKFIDQGSHLIGWMGNESLKIDRYDVRATLSDLAPYEAPPGGYANRLDSLSPAEQKAELLCEEERYYSLYKNEIEEEVYQEEALKRQQSGYGQVGFNYDGPPSEAPALPQHGPEEAEEPEDPFESMPNFDIPRHIEPPDTMRLNAVIEKTARFIAQQGVQMEILIKAKQSNNPQFDFLNMNGRCNLYYKFLVAAIKDGRYPDRVEAVAPPAKENGAARETERKKKGTAKDNGESSAAAHVPLVTSLKYVPSEDCAYSQLISKIQGKPISEIKPSTPEPIVATVTVKETENVVSVSKPTVDFKHKSNSVEVKKISSGLMLAQCYNSETEDEGSDVDEEDKGTSGDGVNATGENGKASVSINLGKLDVPVPPEELRTIVDKTAAYVAKNGKDFEDILRTKKDPRFAFLDEASPYHRYYIYKVTGSIYIPATTPSSSPVKKVCTTAPVVVSGSTECETQPPIAAATVEPPITTVQPVSFTIKALKRDEGASGELPLKSDVRLDDDDDEEDDEDNEKDAKSESDEESLSVADLLEREERKEIRRVEERVRDKLAAAAREKLGLVSKEKQLQQDRKRKAMAFLMQIKKNGGGGVLGEEDATTTGGNGKSEQCTPTVDLTGNGSKEEDERADEQRYRDHRDRQKHYRSRTSRDRSPGASTYRSEKRRSESRSKSRLKSKRKRSSPDREKRHGRSSGKTKKSSRRYRSSSSEASRDRSRSRSRSGRQRDRSRNR